MPRLKDEILLLTDQQREEVHAKGFVRIQAFAADEARAMEDAMWTFLESIHGIDREDRSTWKHTYPSGLQPHKKHPVFDPINSPELLATIDELMGKGKWESPPNWGQFLVTFPETERVWDVPHDWHTDYGFTESDDKLFGLLALIYVSNVTERSGGTGVISGSHRLVKQYVRTQNKQALGKMKRVRKALQTVNPWMKELCSEGDPAERIERFMTQDTDCSGIPLRVVDLSGSPGDVVLGHPWLLHSGSLNCGNLPRMMRVQRLQAGGS